MSMTSTGDRWIATVASIWIQSIAGGTYTFGVYSPIIKSSQSYDQSTLDLISVFKDIGANVGVLSGLLYPLVVASPTAPATAQRWCSFRGPWVVLATGAVQCLLGYLLMWMSVVGLIPRPPVYLMCLFMFLAAHGPTFFSTSTVVTGVMNFPHYSGTIVGIMKGYVGLTGAILIQVYQAFFKGNQSAFILLLAFLPNTLTFLLMFLVKICPNSKSDDKKQLDQFSLISFLLAAFLIIIIISEHIIDFPQWARLLVLLLLVILICSPLKIALESTHNEKTQPLLAESEPLPDTISLNDPTNFGAEKDEENMGIIQALQSLNFWLLFISMSCGMGSGLATIC